MKNGYKECETYNTHGFGYSIKLYEKINDTRSRIKEVLIFWMVDCLFILLYHIMKTKRSITSDRKIETTGLRKDITMSERENIMILLAHIINP